MTATLSHSIKFIGCVYPVGVKISVNAPSIDFVDSQDSFRANISVKVVDSAIETQCDFDKILSDHPYQLWAQAQEITQTLVNLAAFQMGAGAITILNQWVNQNGELDDLAFADPILPPLCTALSQGQDGGFDKVIRIVFAEPALFMALNDLVLANAMPRHVLINCARCVEALRHIIAGPDIERSKAWAMMHAALNVDRAYLDLITTHSMEPRHGKQVQVANETFREVRARTWKIMDRFLHYRLANDKPLSIDSFPLLSG